MVFCVHKAYLVLTRVARSTKICLMDLYIPIDYACVSRILVDNFRTMIVPGKIKDNMKLMCKVSNL